uniref:Ovule protein n=1 Tax=Strongyloides papillosus TaxID=174720 RepID=A0A0N5CFE2_STREA
MGTEICNKDFNTDHIKRNSISSAPTTPNLHSPPAFVLDPANLIYLVPNPVNSKLADVLKPMTKCYRSTARKEKQFTGI